MKVDNISWRQLHMKVDNIRWKLFNLC